MREMRMISWLLRSIHVLLQTHCIHRFVHQSSKIGLKSNMFFQHNILVLRSSLNSCSMGTQPTSHIEHHSDSRIHWYHVYMEW